MGRWGIALLISLPLPAEFLALRVEFQGTDCQQCTESLPDRMMRVRGMESAKLEGNALLVLKLGEGNRVRLEQLRDLIQQDGTKVIAAEVEVRGEVSGPELKSGNAVYGLKGREVAAGPATLKGRVADFTASKLTIEVK
ncbi:MAG: hypothetical protein K2X35_06900 [Bryobacteraceae bacterium]|nr:hypothetical protein [Bryobacteraceae bacterium]